MKRYVKNEQDKMAVEPYPDQVYTKRKKRMNLMSSFPLAESASVKYYASAPLRSVKYEQKTIWVYFGNFTRVPYIRDRT